MSGTQLPWAVRSWNTSEPRSIPVIVANLSSAVAISVGEVNSRAIFKIRWSELLGINLRRQRTGVTPIKVGNSGDLVTAISVGNHRACAILLSGSRNAGATNTNKKQ